MVMIKTQNNIQIKPCPVCGKSPKIYRDIGYESSMLGAWCVIKCKPFFRKPHKQTEVGKSSWERALKAAITNWND